MQIREITKTFDVSRVVPYFQPIMDLSNQCVWHYECLARLINDGQQAFLPSDFLYLIERQNQTQLLTESVFSQCLAYFRHATVPWHINLHSQDIVHRDTQNYLFDCLNSYPKRHNIIFEITEQAVIDEPNKVSQFIERCRTLDVGVYIDNIGSVPTNNISRLLELPVEGIKVSGNLTKQMVENKQAADFIDSLCELAAKRHIHVVAEHVEDENVLNSVLKMGFKYAQGYHFSYPAAQVQHAS
ncbi:EAL domain-containing protein [Aestuariibacter salexigens]|uniref:EAL domain-containing protein n=1 Tax=Aestuariibacter salexigens TaxID=226010 RepID=UPI000428482E|nr:EAL domain-containing protein [Aestuariibacter salexigens]